MCEVFGICARCETKINDHLKEFYSHSGHHPHGWGLACMDNEGVSVEKEPVCASKSNYLRKRLTAPIRVKLALAHIRYATIGNVEYKNCHPYTRKDKSGRSWTLAHNGTIFDYAPLSQYIHEQDGDTDSERILLYIVDKINKILSDGGKASAGVSLPEKEVVSAEKKFALLDSIFVEMSKGNKLNILLCDGEYMYVHTNYEKSLYYLEKPEGTVFSTSPLSKEDWKPVGFARLLAYREGKLVFEGTAHGHRYTDNGDNMKYLYQMYSEL
ncbi:MAG: class II glutamine amidotransferase [Clostridia bacterium]|nr:class II glutamine amidotransferase [Clostridia bacterium]NCC42146.1 class II glutamine amidotransferase [Clostridia bacterium]